MNIYVIQVIILFVFAWCENYGNLDARTKKRMFQISALMLFLVLFCSGKIGGDYQRYHTHFIESGEKNIKQLLFDIELTNRGYYAYNAFIYQFITKRYEIFRALTRCITFFPVIWMIKKTVGYSSTALYIYTGMGFYAFQFSGLKQSIAMGILSFAFVGIYENRRILFYLSVLIAALFHLPSLIFLPAFAITHLIKSKQFMVLTIACIVLIYFFNPQIVKFLGENYDSVIEVNSASLFDGKVLLIFAICAYGYYFYTPTAHNAISIYLLRFMVIAAMLQMFAKYGNAFERLADYYFVYVSIYLPKIFSTLKYDDKVMLSTKNRSEEFYISCMAILVSVFLYFWVYYSHIWTMLPYRTWIFE